MGKIVDLKGVVKKKNLGEFDEILLEVLQSNQEDNFNCEQYLILAVGTDDSENVVNKIKLIHGLDIESLNSYTVAKAYIETISSMCNMMMLETMLDSEEM